MTKLFGESANYLLFTDDVNGVVIDKSTNMVEDIGSLSDLSSVHAWYATDEAESHLYDLAAGALADLRVTAVVASGRMYTIPKTVQSEAKKALEWHKEHGRGGTPVGMNTARILAAGGQIGLKKVRHIARYFPRHEVDKKAKGWKPGDDKFPSNGRIAWALWGGDAGWRWAQAIVERENKKAVNASGYIVESQYSELDDYSLSVGYDANVEVFSEDIDSTYREFVARVNEHDGIDRLYMITASGQVSVWDDGDWDTFGNVDGDIAFFDRMIDDQLDVGAHSHILIDPESAFVLSAHLQQKPFGSVTVEDIDPEEAELVLSALDDMDWDLVDAALLAAGEAPLSDKGGSNKDGNYTPKERSEKAKKQVRDKGGKFAAMGSRVVVGGKPEYSGNITGINPDTQSVTIKMDNGNEVDVPANLTEKAADYAPAATGGQNTQPINMAGILGEPRAPIDRPDVRLPNALPALTPDQLRKALGDFPAWVKSQRDQQQAPSEKDTIKPKTKEQIQAENKKTTADIEKASGVKINDKRGDLRQHPLFKDTLNKKPEYSLYYTPPMSAAATKTAEKAMTPETSDVQPVYMAIVSPEDPRAVFDLVAMVPASASSTSPITYKREDAKWVRDDQILADLTSATPPPVVPLDGDNLIDTLQQIDKAVTAAGYAEFAKGGLDKNRGKAEKLRRYWVYGRGAAKIRWGTPGDWSRCVRHLAKYMGPRAKGYCNLRHHDAIHMWPATHAKVLRGGRKKHFAADELIMEEPVYGFDFDAMAKDKAKTVVTSDDLNREIDEIFSEQDDLFDGEWEPDAEILALIEDGAHEYESGEPIVAAMEGGLDRNRGNAEKLRRYWLYGRGAMKIRWNTPGDWTRCYRHLVKYMGIRAKGYCSLRHKEATGVWPGSKFNIGKKNIRASALVGNDIPSENEVLAYVVAKARYTDARERVLLAGGESSDGCNFRIPLVIPEGVESGDGRKFRKGSIEMRELPLPLLWQIKTDQGHDGSVVVGRIDHMERTDDGIGNAYGVFDTGPYGREAERMVREGFIRGVSADLDRFEASEEEADEAAGKSDKKIGGDKINIDKARVMAVTIVPKPAFQECRIYLEDNTDAGESQEEDMKKMPDGVYVEDMEGTDAQAIVACGMIASSIPTVPPATWFTNPQLSGPTPLTVDDHGRVFGHIAAWNVNHIGMSYGTRPPRSKSKYGYFHTGVVRADDGKDYPVGQLTLAGGHASLEASAVDAARHYDDTGSAIADVHAGEDAHGIWVAGALRPSATPEQIRALRASAPSGDWRPINGALELVAVCQVNVPGFPIARAYVASGQVYALVAAGAQVLARMKTDPIAELAQRVAALEEGKSAESGADLAAQVAAAKARFAAMKPTSAAEKKQITAVTASADELQARIASAAAVAELAAISGKARERLAKEGKALPDGSYPIRNESDLKNAIHAYGRSKPGDRAKVRRHIMKRARALGKADIIPEEWKSASTIDADVDALRAQVASAKAVLDANKAENTES